MNSSSSEQRLKKEYPRFEVVRADLTSQQEAERILEGAAVVLHIGPPFHPRETEMGYNMIDGALVSSKKGTFKHFIYSSALNSLLRKVEC